VSEPVSGFAEVWERAVADIVEERVLAAAPFRRDRGLFDLAGPRPRIVNPLARIFGLGARDDAEPPPELPEYVVLAVTATRIVAVEFRGRYPSPAGVAEIAFWRRDAVTPRWSGTDEASAARRVVLPDPDGAGEIAFDGPEGDYRGAADLVIEALRAPA
jgi:hypothetical protein